MGEYQKENSERAGWGTKRERYGREGERERQRMGKRRRRKDDEANKQKEEYCKLIGTCTFL